MSTINVARIIDEAEVVQGVTCTTNAEIEILTKGSVILKLKWIDGFVKFVVTEGGIQEIFNHPIPASNLFYNIVSSKENV